MRTLMKLLAGSLLALALASQAAVTTQPPAGEALRARYAQLRPALANNPFGRPIHLESRESDSTLRGEVFAVVDHPFGSVSNALQRPWGWCEVMLLPFNTKACSADVDALHVYVGRKKDTPLASAFRVDFEYAVKARDPDYLDVALHAADGPLGTRNYRIALEATPIDGNRTFLHFSYAYGFGALSRIAMSTYLATTGAEKVGFSSEIDGTLVHGVRGVLERNTMRYFLAIDAFLDSLPAPPAVRVEKRLRDWFAATERYPRQLHEMDLDEYLEMKRREYARLAAR